MTTFQEADPQTLTGEADGADGDPHAGVAAGAAAAGGGAGAGAQPGGLPGVGDGDAGAASTLVESLVNAAAADPEVLQQLTQQWMLAQATLAAAAAASGQPTGVPGLDAQLGLAAGANGGDDMDDGSMGDGQVSGGGGTRMKRAAWTTDEEERLVELAGRYIASGTRMCWRQISQELNTGRSSKQCREHYLNSLRPNMKKGGWTQEEEYIIAREHSRIGTHWCQIARKMPGRTDNSIKNFYNATIRSKAVNKVESFLWVYVDLHKRRNMEPQAAFAEAERVWAAHAPPSLVASVFKAGRAAGGGDAHGHAPSPMDLSSLAFTHEQLALINPALVQGAPKLSEFLATVKRILPDASFEAGAANSAGVDPHLVLGMLLSAAAPGASLEASAPAAPAAKRHKGDAVGGSGGAPGGVGDGDAAGQERMRQELLAQLGLAGGARGGDAAQQQLLLTSLLGVQPPQGGGGEPSGSSADARDAGGAGGAGSAAVNALMQQILTQSMLLSAGNGSGNNGAGTGANGAASAGAGASLLSLLGGAADGSGPAGGDGGGSGEPPAGAGAPGAVPEAPLAAPEGLLGQLVEGGDTSLLIQQLQQHVSGLVPGPGAGTKGDSGSAASAAAPQHSNAMRTAGDTPMKIDLEAVAPRVDAAMLHQLTGALALFAAAGATPAPQPVARTE